MLINVHTKARGDLLDSSFAQPCVYRRFVQGLCSILDLRLDHTNLASSDLGDVFNLFVTHLLIGSHWHLLHSEL